MFNKIHKFFQETPPESLAAFSLSFIMLLIGVGITVVREEGNLFVNFISSLIPLLILAIVLMYGCVNLIFLIAPFFEKLQEKNNKDKQ